MAAMWTNVSQKTFGVAICRFKGDGPHGLALNLGDVVEICHQCQDWYFGYNVRIPNLKGIFPASHVSVRPISGHDRCSYHDDPVVEEAAVVLREWGTIWKQLYVKRETYRWTTLKKSILDLMDWRRQLMTGTFTQDHLRDWRLRITSHIDWGNRKLGLDLIPRIDERIVEPDSIGVYELYNVHVASAERSRNATLKDTSRSKSAPANERQTHHLYFSMRHFGCPISGEEVEIQFSLYDMQHLRFVSEKFLVKVLKEGFSSYVDKLNDNATLFTELGSGDLNKELYLVVQVNRIGRLVYTESSKKPISQVYRRPHAVAVLSLSEALQTTADSSTDAEREISLKLYQSEEKDFGLWQEIVSKKATGKFSLLSGQPNSCVVISLRLLHGQLSALRHEFVHLLKNIPLTKKLGFPDVIFPGDLRNDLYLVLERGEFERGGKSSSKNVEVTIMVIDDVGRVIQNALCSGSNAEAVTRYQSVVLYHMNNPTWYEMLKVSLPIEKYYGAHVRFEYRHCSTKDKTEKRLLGFSFTPLMDQDGTVLPDGQLQLLVYKCEDAQRLRDVSSYLDLPYSVRQLNGRAPSISGSVSSVNVSSPSNLPFQRNVRESVTVAFYLCSTKLTQNANLLSLLKWKSHPDKIADTLNLVMRLRGEEMVKFLQDVLDSLFAMFSTEDGNATQHSGLVFEVLVHILSLLDDSKFEHFKPVVDAYINNHFSAALAYKGLLTCVQKCTDRLLSTERQEPIQKCFRTFEFLFKFVIQSRLLYARATDGENHDDFREYVSSLFATFNKVVSLTNENLVDTQVVLLNHIFPIVDQLGTVMTKAETAKLLASLIDSLPNDCSSPVATARMRLVLRTVKSSLYTDRTARMMLLPTISRQLCWHFNHRTDLSLCTDSMGYLMNFYRNMNRADEGNENGSSWYRDVEIITLKNLSALVTSVLLAERANSSWDPLVACLLSVLQLMDRGHYERLWNDLSERKPLKDFLLRLFLVLRNLVNQDVFPSDWRTMHCVANRIILSSLENLAEPLISYFLDAGCFDSQLWNSYFELAVAFLTQQSLQLEKCTESQRKKMLAEGGDMRVQMGFQILAMWNAIGDYKIHFIPSMVGQFLQVTLVPEPELRRATLPIFFDMIDCEQRHRGNFKQVECELIDKLDILVGENKGDDSYKELFNIILLDKVKSCDVTWKNNGAAFINSITRLLERLLDYRNVMEGEENRDKRMSCTFNLLNFYKNEVERRDMYLRYIYKLHSLHLSAENYTEAALTLQLHASQLKWSMALLPAEGDHPTQPEWQRKEQLYMKSIAYFDRGKCWEKGIPLCKELAHFYETSLYDYGKLSHILRMQATFFDNILTQLRHEPEYFRVGFYGYGFPLFLRNKVFVYRGLEYERMSAFTQRLQTEFPSANILTKNTPPGDDILASEGQHIQICSVKPIHGPHPIFEMSLTSMQEKILSYHRVNDVNRFQLDRPVHKGVVDKDNEFKSLWIERTVLTTEHSLPGILRWFEVVDSHCIAVSPIQFACETVASVNKELMQLTALHAAEPKRNINPFSMRLQGVIDANVMGGIAKYQEAFFTPDYINSHPNDVEYVIQLRQNIVEQKRVLDEALALHGKLAPPGVQPLHKRLVECLAQMNQRLKDWGSPSPSLIRCSNGSQSGVSHATPPHHRRADSDAGIEYHKHGNTPLPPTPIDRKSQRSLTHSNVTGVSSNRSSSSSSSLYGHLVMGEGGSDEEDLYCRPSEILEKLQAANINCSNASTPTPGTETPRQITTPGRSSRSKSPRWANSQEYIFYTPSSLRDSGVIPDRDSLIFNGRPVAVKPTPPRLASAASNSSLDEMRSPRKDAPPLPPRSSKSSVEEVFSDSPPPIQPKRISKRIFSPSALTSPDVVDSPPSFTGTLRQHRTPPAPPLPPKNSTNPSINPLSPVMTQTLPPPIPPHRVSNSTSFSNPLELGSGSLVDEVCSLLAASGHPGLSNGRRGSSSPPTSPPPPPPAPKPSVEDSTSFGSDA